MNGEDVPVSAAEDDALPSMDGYLDEAMSVGEAQDRQHTARDRALAVDEWGTTADEERAGEPLDLRLSREEPDLTTGDGPFTDDPYPQAAGRLVDLDGGGPDDTERDLVATDVGRDRGIRSAEEAAMQIRDEVPGGSWSDGDYVEGE